MPYLRAGDVGPIISEIEVLAQLPRVSYIKIYDGTGKLVIHAEHAAAARPGVLSAPDEKARLIELHTDMIDPVSRNKVGEAQVAISTETLEEILKNLLWRSVALGAFAVFVLAIAAWYIGSMLARQLEKLVGAVERVETDKSLWLKTAARIPRSTA